MKKASAVAGWLKFGQHSRCGHGFLHIQSTVICQESRRVLRRACAIPHLLLEQTPGRPTCENRLSACLVLPIIAYTCLATPVLAPPFLSAPRPSVPIPVNPGLSLPLRKAKTTSSKSLCLRRSLRTANFGLFCSWHTGIPQPRSFWPQGVEQTGRLMFVLRYPIRAQSTTDLSACSLLLSRSCLRFVVLAD